MTDNEIRETLIKRDAERTDKILKTLYAKGARCSWETFGKRTTICFIVEKDGHETVGVAHTKDPENFDLTMGKRWSLEDAINKLGTGRFLVENNL